MPGKKKEKNSGYYEQMTYLREKVQVDVKYVPKRCLSKELQEKGERFYYDKVFYTLEDLRNREKYWIREYNNFPMRPIGWLSPKEKLKEYICTVK